MQDIRNGLDVMKLLIRIYPDLIAFICGILIIPWVIGVPGHPTKAVLSGWTIGLIVMGVYLVIYQAAKSLMTFEFYKKTPSFHRPIRALLNGAAICVLPVLFFSFLLMSYFK